MKMTCQRQDVGLSNIVIQLGSLTSILEKCLGPYGRSVLLEHAGCVIITRDGGELLSLLEIEDPLLKMIVKGIVDQTKFLGDGFKISLLLLRRMLGSLVTHFPFNSDTAKVVQRQKMIQTCHKLRKILMDDVQKHVIQYGCQIYPIHNFEAFGQTIELATEDFFITKFSRLIAKSLTKLFSTYIFSECSNSAELLCLLRELNKNAQSSIVEVYNMPVMKSFVSSGFLITKNFKYLYQHMKPVKVSFVLWSVDVEENTDDTAKAIIETSCDEFLFESLSRKQAALESCLLSLGSLSCSLIISSKHFPDWAVAMCRKHQISLLDLVDGDEMNYLIKKFNTLPISEGRDIHPGTMRQLERLEMVHIGTCSFVQLHGIQVNQMVLCGPTPSQCKQFSTSFLRLFKYLYSWLYDCLNFTESKDLGSKNDLMFEEREMYEVGHKLNKTGTSLPEQHILSLKTRQVLSVTDFTGDTTAVMYSVPHNGYVELLARYLVLEDIVGNVYDNKMKSVIMDVLNEIPLALYKKVKYNQKSYIEWQTRLYNEFKELQNDNKNMILVNANEDNKFKGCQNPFLLFRVLDCVLQYTEYILRVECIVSGKHRISSLVSRHESDDSDNE